MRSIFVCSACGNEFPVWSGRCEACGQWNSLKEVRSLVERRTTTRVVEPISLAEIKATGFVRLKTGIGELDRVLGGGLVPGSVLLLGGDPGIGKSTLLLQVGAKLGKVLYVSGEESAEQLKLRSERLQIDQVDFTEGKIKDSISVLAETEIDPILATVESRKPRLFIIDSIQTMFDPAFPSTPGSIVQVRETALKIQKLAKESKIPAILVGHVTKEGTVAGPRSLEHLVDVLIYLEGERYQQGRILRGVKNRFGPVEEIGLFEMGEAGLREVTNPSKLFLQSKTNTPGSIVTATLEGTRPLLVEIQALTSPTVFGYPRRAASGFDPRRLELLLAVLNKRAGLNLLNQDVYINVAGGLQLSDRGADLPVVLAIASTHLAKPVPSRLCLFGEIGLSGELREVRSEKIRVAEARRLNFSVPALPRTLTEALKRFLRT